MASMGHPIVGDMMHGYESHLAETARIGENRLCLHAKRLSINAWCMTPEGKYKVCRVVVDSDTPF
jgi:23S rRNA-/tRNA-specific pseudouridylate synthase